MGFLRVYIYIYIRTYIYIYTYIHIYIYKTAVSWHIKSQTDVYEPTSGRTLAAARTWNTTTSSYYSIRGWSVIFNAKKGIPTLICQRHTFFWLVLSYLVSLLLLLFQFNCFKNFSIISTVVLIWCEAFLWSLRSDVGVKSPYWFRFGRQRHCWPWMIGFDSSK